jgi:rhodanese-related sulfurtransferase
MVRPSFGSTYRVPGVSPSQQIRFRSVSWFLHVVGRLTADDLLADARRDLGRLLIAMCDEGFQSSLAAANLRRLGFERATDLAGGFQAWRAACLPVSPARRRSRSGGVSAR